MNKVRDKFLKREKCIGSWLMIDHYLVPDILSSAGFEFLVIDLEHTTTDLSSMSIVIDKILMNSIAPMVRLPSLNEEVIKKALDAGAEGIICPTIKTKEDVQKLIDYCFYPPTGKRGVGLFKAQKFKDNFDNYVKSHKDDITVIAQIEHIDAVKNIEDILSVDRLDGVIIGPYDLSASLGFPGQFDRPEFKTALDKVIKSVRASGKSLGFHVIEPSAELAQEKFSEGYNFVAFSIDFLFLKRAAENEMKKLLKA